MPLNETPELKTWAKTHLVFLEKIGPFMETASQAWQELHQMRPAVDAHNEIEGVLSLYKNDPKRMVYRACFALAAAPKELPAGLRYELFLGGTYHRFVISGSYAQLPSASGRVFELAKQKHLPCSDGYRIENYTNDPRTTPEEQLVTEIWLPTA